jgi:hypothetical protein
MRPGDTVIGTACDNPALYASAAKDPETGKAAVVIVNDSSRPVTATVAGFDANVL